MGTLANSEDPDEMPQDAAFHMGLHCLLRLNKSSEKEIQYFFWKLIITSVTPQYNTMDHLVFIVYSYMENSISLKRVHLISMHTPLSAQCIYECSGILLVPIWGKKGLLPIKNSGNFPNVVSFLQ